MSAPSFTSSVVSLRDMPPHLRMSLQQYNQQIKFNEGEQSTLKVRQAELRTHLLSLDNDEQLEREARSLDEIEARLYQLNEVLVKAISARDLILKQANQVSLVDNFAINPRFQSELLSK